MPFLPYVRRGWRDALLAAAIVATLVACRREPADPAAVVDAQSLGLDFLHKGQLAEAEAQFTRLVSLAPRDAAGYGNLGVTYLRANRLTDAERELRRGRRLAPGNADISLALAKLYVLTERAGDARVLLDALLRDGPDSARVLYAIAELEARDSTTAGRARHEERLSQVVRLQPTNIAARLRLVRVLARRGAADDALAQLEEVRRLPPEPPGEARESLARAVRLLQSGNLAEAGPPLDRFIDVMEVTAPYQAALARVQWLEGPLVGRPVLALAPQSVVERRRGGLPAAQLARFVDASSEVGLPAPNLAIAAVAATDDDGTVRLFTSVGAANGSSARTILYQFRGGAFADVFDASGISLPAGASFGGFADLDNDGRLDLFAVGGDGRLHLFLGTDSDRFDDVTARAGFPRIARSGAGDHAHKALFVDLDHDGDLDVVLLGGERLLVLRNNLDGSFTETAVEMGLSGPAAARDGVFADFDDDGRIDLLVVSADRSVLYRNTGARRFADVATRHGLPADRGAGAVAVGDYDNDGLLDVFMAGSGASPGALWRNTGDGTFAREARSASVAALLRSVDASAAAFLDYDNDGRLDLLIAGAARAEAGAHGLLLLHNDGMGAFSDRSSILPAGTRAGGSVAHIAILDIQRDGDVDLLLAGNGGIRLLRNDGGNARLSARIGLVALRTGSGKNNTHGIGAKLQVRSGEILQTRVVTGPVTHVGLGPHLKADVLRVQWPNGVPQVVHFPGTDEDVLELEQLKGSCAFLYAWDGTAFRFVTDVMWRSALGMPLGIMGASGGTSWAPADASQEYLRIPGDALRPRDGRYAIQITEELWETAYLDEIRLLAVDHPDSVQLFVDERFVPPAPVRLETVHAVRPYAPLSATNERGENVLPALLARDDVYVSDLSPRGYQGVVEEHDLVLDLGPRAGLANTRLFLRGWIYPTDASINVALSQQSRVQLRMPSLEVRDARGQWKTAIENIGFPSGKDKTIVIDLAGIFLTAGGDHRVRIRTNMQIYWDHAFVASHAPAVPIRVTTLAPASADLHFRGYSRMYRKGGRYGPHWFAYDDVATDAPWRPIEGSFTRFGDVRPLLTGADDQYVIMAPGDETSIEFDAAGTPDLPPGWTRTFLLYTDGWIKDADMNTAFGNTVEPLPFHAIREYPYARGESYPDDEALQRYRRAYNTRVIRRR